MTFYINSVALTDAYVEQRNSKDSWNATSKGATRIPFIERASQDPTTFNIELKILGAERYNVATSIAAEIDACMDVCLWDDGSKKLYGSDTHIWLAQSEFKVVEEAGHRLICDLSGDINTYIIHSCDMTQWWTGDNGGTIATNDPHDGKQSVKFSKTSPSAFSDYTATYTLPQSKNISGYTHIGLWLKCNKSSGYFDSIECKLASDASNYKLWYASITADTWTYQEFEIASPHGSVGTLDETALATFEITVNTDSGTDDFDVYIDQITVR